MNLSNLKPVCNVPDAAPMRLILTLCTLDDLHHWLRLKWPGNLPAQKSAALAWAKLCYRSWKNPQNFRFN